MKHALLSVVCSLLCCFCSVGQSHRPEVRSYVDFLRDQHTGAKDYILQLFKTHDVVVLCERNHGEITQYDLIYEIVQSEYFRKEVGNVFTEIGGVDSRAGVLAFLNTAYSSREEKEIGQLEMYRTIDPGIWDKTNFYNLLGRLNSLNV